MFGFNKKPKEGIAALEEKVKIYENLTQQLNQQFDNMLKQYEAESNMCINLIKQNNAYSKLTDFQEQEIIKLRKEIELLKVLFKTKNQN